MLFDNTDFNYEVNFLNNNFNFETKNTKFLTPDEAFMRGNSENGTFVPYKQYTYYKLKPENEQENMLIKLMAYSFIINDLNLYLDLHPEDTSTFEKFKKYAKELSDIQLEYTQKYGPIVITETQGANFNWLKNPWPWDKTGGSMYV